MSRIDATNEFASQPPVGQRVVAVLGSNVPTRRSGGQPLSNRLPVERFRQTDVSVNGVQPTLVRQQLSHSCITLTVLSELWPVGADFFVI